MYEETFDRYVEMYGVPVLRFETRRTDLTEEEMAFGDIPDECAVFKINHATQFMVVSRHGNTWHANHGERSVIAELLKRVSQQDVAAHSRGGQHKADQSLAGNVPLTNLAVCPQAGTPAANTSQPDTDEQSVFDEYDRAHGDMLIDPDMGDQ
jgi:hypothetical protein